MDHEWWDWCDTVWMCVYRRIDSKESVCPRVELFLQGDHNDLAAFSGHHPEKSCNLKGNNVFLSWQIKNIKARFWDIEAGLTLPMFVLSRAASTSSSTKNGAGRKLRLNNNDLYSFLPHQKHLYLSSNITWQEVCLCAYAVFHLWMAKTKARAAMAFSPPDRLSMAMNRFPGATQL